MWQVEFVNVFLENFKDKILEAPNRMSNRFLAIVLFEFPIMFLKNVDFFLAVVKDRKNFGLNKFLNYFLKEFRTKICYNTL